MRINKFIASNTEFSRRKADELIREGKVFLNDEKIKELGINIDPEKDKIRIENSKDIKVTDELLYIVLHKPADYVTTRNDELGRRTIMELIPKNKNLKPIGRLDKNTEGLILFSNDGDFIQKYTHPKYECEKEYLAIVKGKITNAEIKKLQSGMKIDGKKTAPAKIKILKNSNQEAELTITIHEGRNRQIRKMFDQIAHNVKYLRRIRIGNLTLSSLKKGEYKKLTKKEIDDI